MTSVNIIVGLDHVTVVTDTRATISGGHMRFDVTKAHVFPHMNLMIATRGQLTAQEKFGRLVQEFACDLAGAVEVVKKRITDGNDEVYLAGFQGAIPRAFRVTAEDGKAIVLDLPGGCASPSVAVDEFAAYASNPVEGMPKLLANQARRTSACGGFANVHTMRMEGNQTVTTVYTMCRIPEAKRVLER